MLREIGRIPTGTKMDSGILLMTMKNFGISMLHTKNPVELSNPGALDAPYIMKHILMYRIIRVSEGANALNGYQ